MLKKKLNKKELKEEKRQKKYMKSTKKQKICRVDINGLTSKVGAI